jgi:hypothetical protein
MVAKGTNRASPIADGVLEKLRAVLESQKQLGPRSYPPTAQRLLELSGEPSGLAWSLVSGARAQKTIVSTAKRKDAAAQCAQALVFLPDDADEVACSEGVLRHALARARAGKSQLFTAAELARSLPTRLQKPFKEHWVAMLRRGELPPGLGSLRGKSAACFVFNLGDILPSVALPGPATSESVTNRRPGHGDFAQRFAAAFDRLDRESGSQNYVTLYALRAALPDVFRADFDAGLNELRRGKSRTFTLDSSDGRHGRLGQPELDAGIAEQGNLLVYVARIGGRRCP